MERRANDAPKDHDWQEVRRRNRKENHYPELVSRLNGVVCGNSRIKANQAKYERKKVPPAANTAANINESQRSRPPVEDPYGHSGRRSFADVLNNRGRSKDGPYYPQPPPPPPPQPHIPLNQQTKEIRFTTSTISRIVAKWTLIGESESFEKLMNIRAFKEVEGIPNIELRYVGGLNTLMEFEDETEMQNLLVNGEHIWSPWFKSLIPWNQDTQLNKRIASLLIYGVPLHAWCEEAFTTIASTWGKVLIPEVCKTENLNMAFGRVGILTDHPGLISSADRITVDDKMYVINVIEDLFESNRLNPMLACNDIESDYNRGEWAPDWRSEMADSDGDFAGSELPETPPRHSPEMEESPRTLGNEKSSGHERSDQISRRQSKSRRLSAQSCNLENIRELNDGAPNVTRLSPGNSSAQQELQNGPDLNKSLEMGRKARTEAKPLDLNTHPTQSVDSRLSRLSPLRPREISPQASPLSQARDPTGTCNPSVSLSSSKELEATIELGRKIGFQFSGNNEQMFRLLRNKGDANVSQ
ncbi:hypothetical protein L1887_23845 [Cichorium endivia]|nr:hypothetical protein L1887_23845 [Cichorium endivia]